MIVDTHIQDIFLDKHEQRSSPVLEVKDNELAAKGLPSRPSEPAPAYQEGNFSKSRRSTFDFVRKSLNLRRRPKSVKKDQKRCVIL